MRRASVAMLGRIREATRLVHDHLPLLLPARAARRFVVQAGTARDARLYGVAASLFEEAARLTPGNGRIHLQCGHMFKEAKDYASAERHYGEAQRLLPPSPELALQLGHFYKVAGRVSEAELAYADALKLRPEWEEAREEIARVRSGAAGRDDEQEIIAELLPREGVVHRGPASDMIRIWRLGGTRVRSRGRILTVLRGVEAIRGFIASSVAVERVELLVDGTVVRAEALDATPVAGAPGRNKYVFNLWHDFTDVPAGRRTIVLRFQLTSGKPRLHRQSVLVTAPPPADALAESDGYVPPMHAPVEALVDRVNALPSMIRPVARTPLPQPIRSILVQRVDQLGDLVCSVPAIRLLREFFPQARLVGMLSPANAGLGRSLGLFDEVVVADFTESPAERRRTISAESQIALREALHAHDFDIAIDLGEGSDSRPLLLLSGARFLYGFKEREAPWLTAGLEMNGHDPVNGLEIMPPSRKMLALVQALGAMHRGAASALPRTDLDRRSLEKYGVGQDRRFVLLHAGARLAYSRWPGFGALASLLLARTDLSVVILVDDPAEAPALPPSDRLHLIVGRLPFDDFEALLAFCAVFVGNDSGPKHLASLRGAKVVSLHMARLNWNEWGQEISGAIVSRRVPCAGCAISYDAEDCGKDFACIRRITPEEVFEAAMAQLDGPAAPPSA